MSKVGVEVARTTFPHCEFHHAAWPQDLDPERKFDVIWAVDPSVINTFDVQTIKKGFC